MRGGRFGMVRSMALAVIALAVCGSAALAAPARQAAHGDWEVYRDSASDVCFAMTRPVDATPRELAHNDVYFLVSSWRGGRKAQPSFHAGYSLSPMRAPRVSVGSRSFRSYADANEAFLHDEAEPALIEAMRDGANMRVEAQTEDGERTAYEFSLIGVSAAIRAIDALC